MTTRIRRYAGTDKKSLHVEGMPRDLLTQVNDKRQRANPPETLKAILIRLLTDFVTRED